VGTIGFREPVVSETTEAVETSSPHETVPEEKSEVVPAVAEHTAATKFIPLLRGPTADLNMTIALALIAVFAMQYFGFKTLGLRYGGRFVNVKNPIMFFVGLLEIVSDISKVISFAFRLFGNIFAGEVLLAVMAFLMPFIAPMPFLMLELFVGFIQALVFSTLTAVFINVALAHEE
jgi:F-type H+-transporting ATPase subunit a